MHIVKVARFTTCVPFFQTLQKLVPRRHWPRVLFVRIEHTTGARSAGSAVRLAARQRHHRSADCRHTIRPSAAGRRLLADSTFGRRRSRLHAVTGSPDRPESAQSTGVEAPERAALLLDHEPATRRHRKRLASAPSNCRIFLHELISIPGTAKWLQRRKHRVAQLDVTSCYVRGGIAAGALQTRLASPKFFLCVQPVSLPMAQWKKKHWSMCVTVANLPSAPRRACYLLPFLLFFILVFSLLWCFPAHSVLSRHGFVQGIALIRTLLGERELHALQ